MSRTVFRHFRNPYDGTVVPGGQAYDIVGTPFRVEVFTGPDKGWRITPATSEANDWLHDPRNQHLRDGHPLRRDAVRGLHAALAATPLPD